MVQGGGLKELLSSSSGLVYRDPQRLGRSRGSLIGCNASEGRTVARSQLVQ
jgi:hypothetical protein